MAKPLTLEEKGLVIRTNIGKIRQDVARMTALLNQLEAQAELMEAGVDQDDIVSFGIVESNGKVHSRLHFRDGTQRLLLGFDIRRARGA